MVEYWLESEMAELSPSTQRLLKLMDEMPGGFFVYSAQGREEILYANTALIRLFGCESRDEFQRLTGGTFPGMVFREDLEAVEKSIWEQVGQSQFDLDYVEYRIRRKDGTIRWLEDHGHFVQTEQLGGIFYVFVADATEKIQSRAELLKQNAQKDQQLLEYHQESSRRRELIEGLSIDYESIFYVQLEKDLIHAYRLSRQVGDLFFNDPPSRDYKGFVREYVERWVHPEDRELIFDILDPQKIQERLEHRQILHVNYRLLRGDRPEYLQLRVVNVGAGEKISQVVIGARSVDEEIRNALEQKEFLAGALSQAKSAMAAKNVFLSNMSHDMRTPLNAIMGFTKLAKGDVQDSPRLLRDLEQIDAASRQLLELVSNVLEIARIESGGEAFIQEPCDLLEIAKQVKSTLLPQAQTKNISLRIEAAGLRHSRVYGDSRKLEEILFHLCSNAVKYTGNGGHVVMELQEIPSVGPTLHRYQIAVEDNGIGINPSFLSHIFEFFAREQNTTLSGVHGTGLGLPIVKNLTEMMGGTIEVKSEPGKGSRFTIVLPLKSQEERDPPFSEKKLLPLTQRGKLLVVDDNELNLEIALEMLRDEGFQVEASSNGKEAVERLKNSEPNEFFLVLMDIQMPVMDGYHAAREIRALEDPLLSRIPIIALSANAFEEDKLRALESGMNAHIAKPLEMKRLLEEMERLVGG